MAMDMVKSLKRKIPCKDNNGGKRKKENAHITIDYRKPHSINMKSNIL